MTQHPKFLKPGDVADFPKRRIDGGESRSDELIAFEIAHQIQGARTKLARQLDQSMRIDGANIGR